MVQWGKSPWSGWETERQERRNRIPPKMEEAQKSGVFELCLEQLAIKPLVRHGRTLGIPVKELFCDTEASQCLTKPLEKPSAKPASQQPVTESGLLGIVSWGAWKESGFGSQCWNHLRARSCPVEASAILPPALPYPVTQGFLTQFIWITRTPRLDSTCSMEPHFFPIAVLLSLPSSKR